MSSISNGLLDNSIQAAISSIEIYNKPDFKYREQIFTILNINAWELLLKAKVLKDANDDLESLYIPLPDCKYKTTRSGNYLTIDINKAMKQLSLDQALIDNLGLLIEIRDTAVHFYETASATQESFNQSSNFYFICEVATEIKSAKKLLEKPSFITGIDNNSDSVIVLKEQNPIDKYPISYLELWERVKKAKPRIKQKEMNDILKKLKGNPKYSHYNFRTKKLQETYKKTGKLSNDVTIIYNEDAVRYVIENFDG